MTFFHSFYKDKDFSKWEFTLVGWPEGTNTNKYRVSFTITQTNKSTGNMQTTNITSKYKTT